MGEDLSAAFLVHVTIYVTIYQKEVGFGESPIALC